MDMRGLLYLLCLVLMPALALASLDGAYQAREAALEGGYSFLQIIKGVMFFFVIGIIYKLAQVGSGGALNAYFRWSQKREEALRKRSRLVFIIESIDGDELRKYTVTLHQKGVRGGGKLYYGDRDSLANSVRKMRTNSENRSEYRSYAVDDRTGDFPDLK